MTKEELNYFIDEWIDQAENTNEYCERSLIVSSLEALEEGNIEEGIRRLRQIIPDGKSKLVDIPKFLEK